MPSDASDAFHPVGFAQRDPQPSEDCCSGHLAQRSTHDQVQAWSSLQLPGSSLAGSFPPAQEILDESWCPGFGLAQSWLLQTFAGNEQADGNSPFLLHKNLIRGREIAIISKQQIRKSKKEGTNLVNVMGRWIWCSLVACQSWHSTSNAISVPSPC